MLLFLLTIPGLLAAYFLLVRPLLHKLPVFQQFYADADGFWQSVWAVCGKSLTMAINYATMLAGLALQAIDPLAAAAGDPDLRQQITNVVADPKVIGYITMALSFITIVARLRSIGKA